MNFFTHNQAVKAISFLYPEVKDGIHYRCLMYVADNPEFIPMSDAWVENWTAEGVEQPSIEYLKQVYADNDLDNWSAITRQPSIQGAQTL
jgi:hypothetical protein